MANIYKTVATTTKRESVAAFLARTTEEGITRHKEGHYVSLGSAIAALVKITGDKSWNPALYTAEVMAVWSESLGADGKPKVDPATKQVVAAPVMVALSKGDSKGTLVEAHTVLAKRIPAPPVILPTPAPAGA